MWMLLLLLLLQTSLQQQTPPPGRCDISQRVDVHTSCTSCAAVSSCPHGFSSGGTTNCSYVVEIGGREMALDGCQHICMKGFMQPQCCPQHWGPLCLSCPSWSGKTCNFHGTCSDGDLGNGTCICDDGYSGFACQECKKPNFFGEKCDKECDCEHGVCNKGPEGDGQCLCQPPYTGKRCDQVGTSCSNCSPYSYCKGEAAGCECLPGYRRTTPGKCASICSPRDCDVNAQCSSQGSRVTCVCKPDYQGDGKICVPRNPCSENNGGCPINSTVCVFKGPNKSSCECMSGMAPEGGSAEFGCQLVSACSADTCDPTAVCQTELDGHPRCTCEPGQIGDGHRCYGTLMERLIELDRTGSQRENLTGAVAMFEKGCSMLLSHNGPFTAFIPVLKTPLTGVNEELMCKNHLILGQHLYKDLEGRDFTLYGGSRWRSKDNKRFILMENPSRLYNVIQEDLPAANGIIHIIDRPITNTLSDKSPRDERFADKTIGEILTKDEKYNRFLSLADNCGAPPPLRGPGPLTVFVPTNEAVDKARDGSILYMLHEAKYKLQELLRHHVFSQAVLTVDELTALPQIQTMANQIITITVSNDGEILLGEKGVHLTSTNIVASNGIIHMIDGLLFPPSILPILPHRCDVTESKIVVSPCVHCSYLYETECPEGTTEMTSHQIGCEYVTSPLRPTLSKGCAKFCNATKKVAQCCKGFYGPDCKPCIGGFQHPCYDKGTCFDGIHGNGSCSCQPGLKGVACHICVDPSKHGENCDEECRCVHGVCDNRPGSGGVCRRGSCTDGYSGDSCDKMAMACNSDGLQEHCHIHAYCIHTGLHTKCLCLDGYEGDGHSCSPINPCLKSNRGGCHSSAECVFVSPGSAVCVCVEGWTGDGRVCVEINNCQLESHGGCSLNADCIHIGPGQSDCICKTGYMGNGIVCDLINPCLKKNGGCHDLAQCEVSKEGGAHTCTCPDGYSGDGSICFGSLLEELDMNPKLYIFFRMTQKYSHFSEDLDGNLTVLVPSREAMRNMSSDQESFWTGRHHLPHFLRAHILPGVYSIEDLDRMVGSRLLTLNPVTYWEISNSSGGIHIGNASIVTHNLPAINGYIHIIDRILAPSRSDLPPEPPTLMAFLNSSSSFTLFRQYALMYNLSDALGTSDFTLLLPTDDAVRQHLSRTNSSLLDSDVFKYHVILNELLFPDHLSDGTLKSTLLGSDYQVQFHLNDNNQTAVNDVPLNGTFTETQNGVVMVIPRVLKTQRNRCSKEVKLQVNGRCTDCDGPARCLFSSKPIKEKFPANMRSNCKYRKRVGKRRKTVPGCVIKCLRITTDHSCCPGYYGHECFKCPGGVGSWCSNHGECQDGTDGNGECRCFEGFHGTACEDCEPGRYGVNCSSKCVCNHGKCEDGLAGSGKCVCHKGWKGASCSIEIKDDACGGVCDENANCVTGPKGTAAACVCVAGYEGNGTHCNEMDLCSRSNGGCSEFAVCLRVSAGERTCTCEEGFTGDGVVCLEIDGCLVNNGGCHKSADCIRTGPNKTACTCRIGFHGPGRFCFPVNPCRTRNGGCSVHARCEYMGQGQRNCTCYKGHVGDGFECRGTTNNEVFRNLENAFFRRMLSKSTTRGFHGDGPFTVFVPVEETNKESTVNEWEQSGRLSDLIRYHIVSCEVLTLNDLKTTKLAVATSGHKLHFSLQQGSVWVNNRSRIVKSDYTTSNGVIHHIDTLLTPYRLQDRPSIQASTMNFTSAAVFYGYSRFYKLVEDVGLLPVLQMSIHQPLTMFWPTDEALSSLPAERQHWLSSPDHREQVASLVKAHVIRNAKLVGIAQPDKYASFRTMHGSTISYHCDKTLVGAVLLNENAARVVERYLNFKEGVAYGIDQLLEPPGIGALCDSLENRTTSARCGRCIVPPACHFRHHDTGKTEPCLNRSPSLGRRHSHWYPLDNPFSMAGCKRVCQFPSWVKKCCKNHYGRDCQVCPGGLEAPCSNHGYCDDGMQASGRCRCFKGFKGDACELCVSSHYGPNCTDCNCGQQGRCDEGIDGSGKCSCNPGWQGEDCRINIDLIPEECRRCHAQADCAPGSGCRCKSGFQGNGTFCDPEPPPDLCSEYNGGCHQNAVCNQTVLLVNCTCRSGYQGDGYSCEPINRCIEEQNGGCSDFAVCKFTGPNERLCECLPGFMGNGVQCLEKVVPPVDRCLEDNGGCDPAAICKDLHYHTNTAGVFHLRSPDGKYKMNFSQAAAACRAEGATLVSFKQLGDAQQLGMHLCVAGWMEEGKVGYPTRFPSARCGDNHVGLVVYKEPVDRSSKYDAYCYRVQDVSCECPAGYIGNGDFCNGVLTSVLATYSNFSIFYKLLLDYSGRSSEGKQLVQFMSHRKSEVTLFVPHNAGFGPNQTLSGRDLEYHVSTNHSIRPFKDLKHQEVIISRLGFNLTVTHGDNENSKLVNRRMLLEWDIPAVNGIIHVIEGPLTAPPAPIPHHASRGHAHSSATVSAILVSVLLACVLAVLGYYVFKHKTDAFRFHYFRNEDEDGPPGGRTKPTLVSIPNPLYSGSRAFSEPFGDAGQGLEPEEPEEPPKILDLDQ